MSIVDGNILGETQYGCDDTTEEEDWWFAGTRAAKTYNDDHCRVFCRIIGHDQRYGLYSLAHSHFVAEKTPFPLGFLLLRHPVQALELK